MRHNLKKLASGEVDTLSPDEEPDAEASLLSLYHACGQKLGLSPRDIDETNLETLFDYLFYKSKPDPNTKVINGKTYKRATKAPSWL